MSSPLTDKEVLDKMAEIVNGEIRDDIFYAYEGIVALLQQVREIKEDFQYSTKLPDPPSDLLAQITAQVRRERTARQGQALVCTCGEEEEAFMTLTSPQHSRDCPKYGRL